LVLLGTAYPFLLLLLLRLLLSLLLSLLQLRWGWEKVS
jgi:hypothetical protein